MKYSVANATKWSTMAEIMAKIAAPIVNMILARALAPEAFGVIASIFIITSFADLFTDAGFQRYLIQHEFKDEKELEDYTNVAFWSNLTMSMVIYCILFIFRRQLAVLVGCPEAYTGLAVAGLAVICTSFSSTIIARLRREMDFKTLFYTRMVSSFTPLFVTVPLAFIMRSYWAMIIGTLTHQVLNAVILTVKSEWKPKFWYRFSVLKNMISFSMWNFMESFSFWFAQQANIFIVATTLSAHYLGLYKTAMQTINSYMAIITASVTPVLFSLLSRQQNDDEKFQSSFFSFQRIIAMCVLPMGTGMLIYRELVVKILLGEQWMELAGFLGIWALMSAIAITFGNTACEVYRSKGKPKISFYLQLAYLFIYIPVIKISVGYGFDFLCIASTVVRLIPIILDFILLKFVFKFSVRKIFKNVSSQILATAVMAIFALTMQRYIHGSFYDFIVIFMSVGVYFGIIMLFPKNRNFIIPIIRKNVFDKIRRKK